MKRKVIILSFAAVMLYFADHYISAQNKKLNIGIVGNDLSVYGEMVSNMSRSPYLQLIERKDLKPLFKELELKQAGIVIGSSDSRLKGIDYLVMVDKSRDRYFCRIVRIGTGEIIVAFDGDIRFIADKCVERLETDISLHAIEGLSNDKGLRVVIQFSAASYKVGEKISFTIKSPDADGYLYLLDRQPDGTMIVLLPNRKTGDYKIRKGETVELPGALGFQIKASRPVGCDKFIAIVTREPIDITKFGLTTEQYYTEVTGNMKKTLTRGMSVEIEQLPEHDWGIASKEIIITK